MVACFGSISHAPIAVLLLVTEMTGSVHLMLASILALGIAVVITGTENIYRAQLVDRSASPAHRQATGGSSSTTVSVGECMVPPRLVSTLDTKTSDALAKLRETSSPGAVVVDSQDAIARWSSRPS